MAATKSLAKRGTPPMKKKNMVKKTRPHTAIAIVKSDRENHFVGLGNLRVIICEEEGIWFAQCLEIDYAASGNSLAEVKRNFEHGLASTITLHLREYNTITKLLVPAPPEVWRELALEKRRFLFDQVSTHKVEFEALPYSGISYIETCGAAA